MASDSKDTKLFSLSILQQGWEGMPNSGEEEVNKGLFFDGWIDILILGKIFILFIRRINAYQSDSYRRCLTSANNNRGGRTNHEFL